MLKLTPILRVLQTNEILPMSTTTDNSGMRSPLDWMYVTTRPAVTTLGMAKNHTKTKSNGVKYQGEWYYEREDSSQA